VAKTLATVRSALVVSPRARSSKEILHRFVGSLDIDDERTHSFPALEWLRSHFGDVEQVLSCNNLETIKRIVVRGGGIAILPLYMIQKELDGDRLQIFDQKYFYDGQLKLIMRAGENLSVRAKVLIDAIEHYATGVTHR
jgi:DNA-binding transcriptional LysR family regulator